MIGKLEENCGRAWQPLSENKKVGVLAGTGFGDLDSLVGKIPTLLELLGGDGLLLVGFGGGLVAEPGATGHFNAAFFIDSEAFGGDGVAFFDDVTDVFRAAFGELGDVDEAALARKHFQSISVWDSLFAVVHQQNYNIEPLNPSKHRREEFDCGVEALNDYLKKRARKEMDAGLAVCFVAAPASDPGCIAGFYTLSAATILTSTLPEAVIRKLPRYGDFPATLLGRLARSTAFKGQGLGDRLMMSAFARAVNAAEEVASWAIVTDPKDDNARRFYEEFGFSELSENRLFMTMKQVTVLLAANAR